MLLASENAVSKRFGGGVYVCVGRPQCRPRLDMIILFNADKSEMTRKTFFLLNEKTFSFPHYLATLIESRDLTHNFVPFY